MDFNEVNKIASRKKITAEAKELREKVSRETQKIIKLKVAQDTAYWDLKEKLHQVESNHEKLQQNMVEVQMQHEAISGQYQEELRLRPDTLNKVSCTREICVVLQNNCERLRATLARCTADQAALSEAFQRSGQVVRDLRAQHDRDLNTARVHATGLEEKLKMMTDHQSQLLHMLTIGKQQADTEVSELRSQLGQAQARKEELVAAQNELQRTLDQRNFEIEMKEEMNANLQAEMKQIMQDFNSQATQARATLANLEKEINGLKEENHSLKKAVENQDQFAKSLYEHNNTLQEKIAIVEDKNVALQKTNDELKTEAENASNLNESLQHKINTLNEDIQKAKNALQILSKVEEDMKNLKANYERLEKEKADVVIELNTAVEESNIKTMEIEKLTNLSTVLETKLLELDDAFKRYRETSCTKIEELNASINAKDIEIESKAGTMTQLMSQLKISSETLSKLEGGLQKLRTETDLERKANIEKEKEMNNIIAKLENTNRAKDDELSKQMSHILELRNEKERLQEKIQAMQSTIDNVQKELTRPPQGCAPPRSARMEPELDDNAVMFSPVHSMQAQQPPKPALSKPQPGDNMLFTLFSDSESDTLDRTMVNQRFNALARGERLSPVPLSALRRRRSQPGSVRGKNNEPRTSLSGIEGNARNKDRVFFKNKRDCIKSKTGK